MLGRLVEFQTSEGKLWVEIASADDRIRPASLGDKIEKASETFEAAVGRARPILEAVFTNVAAASRSVSEVTVEFGLKLSSEAGVILASQALEANLTVKATWKREGSS